MPHGIGLVPEDRKKQALFLRLAIRTNLTIAAQDQISRRLVHRREPRGHAGRRVPPPAQHPHGEPRSAGGPSSPAAISRRSCWRAGWRCRPKILIVDEPTRGIDVGSKVEVHNLLIEMAKSGIAVIVISSELPEILAVSRSHRHHARGPRHRRDRAQRCDPGNPDVDDDLRMTARPTAARRGFMRRAMTDTRAAEPSRG